MTMKYDIKVKESLSTKIGHINFNTKLSRERSAANLQAAFKAAGIGDEMETFTRQFLTLLIAI
jgi:hypothetical protein